MSARLHAAHAFFQTLWVCRPGRSAADFKDWQERALQRWLRDDLPGVGFYKDAEPHLRSLPVIDKTTVMACFEEFNRARITAEAGWEAFASGGEIDGISIGASTGTSGNRTLYAVTPPERFRWLGSILAKTIPAFLVRPERVAVLLPQPSALYDGANRMPGLQLSFHDLRQDPGAWLGALQAFNPTTIVAPPQVLRLLAETAGNLAPRRLYAGGETLDPVDRHIVEQRFGIPLGQIYMASEGLFAVTCRHGRLHLAEDANHFEFEPVGDGLVSPMVTSFRRSFQILARYRMNDLLRLSERPCPCGSPLQAVDEIVGRVDDGFFFTRPGATRVLVTPDVMRNAVLDAARDITDFRICRKVDGTVSLTLHPTLQDASANAALKALQDQFARLGVSPRLELLRDPMTYRTGPKLRRVENRFRHGE
ncbi:AMP-binding protein [Nitratireductor pacificus]|uniref:Coenzyme F390 synthetase n=1 Tax=Nitratireductor pacificus pht-3B TaxID=391937 RepID=K2MIE9_9HYPH|nr:AMP-binding protein [Nitratireductor pacificus]EKF20485.1 hypothetical protein NA2_01834 [Nitratireductor pacificus pht-3B]